MAKRTGRSRFLTEHGYVMVRAVGHPLANKSGYVFEHRLGWYEAYGSIPEGHVVHHINHVKDDNRLENLEAMSPSEHARLHHPRQPVCEVGHPYEGTNEYVTPKGRRRCAECARLNRLRYRLKHVDELPFRKQHDDINRWIRQQRAEGRTLIQIRDELALQGVRISYETVRAWSLIPDSPRPRNQGGETPSE